MLGMQIGIQKDKTKASPTPPHPLIRIYLDNQLFGFQNSQTYI